ncbi:luciferase family protein [Streptomyces coeruleoprunus]|uniref:Luciferase family protein n=1 Tax=Streptomyces coeruleoprunus TaxID=285563 RepID=A0ABV9XHN1_9ACTN
MTTQKALPRRAGERPSTGSPVHAQLDQNGPAELRQELWRRMTALAGVRPGRSHVSLPQSQALHLDPALATGPDDAYLAGTEFAHLHGVGDGSLHVMLPPQLATEVIAKGWAEHHPLVGRGYLPGTAVMLYSPRDDDELDVVWRLVLRSHAYARGDAA